MRLAFMGTPRFAVPSLKALVEAGHEIAAVYCQPPRRAGRGQAVARSPVHEAADTLGLPVRTPERLRRVADEHAAFHDLGLDAAVVAAYGLILPQAMLDAPKRGCLNVHASLLPRWRGAAPIQAAILAGDAETGVTIMQMDAGLDTGAMRLSEATPIGPRTTASELHDRLAEIGGRLVVRVLETWPPAVPQSETGATQIGKLAREDGRLNWAEPADALDRRIRAFDLAPGTFTTLEGEPFKIHRAAPEPGDGAPGEVLDERLLVATGRGALRLLRVQAPGRAAMDAAVFLRGRRVPVGSVLGADRPT